MRPTRERGRPARTTVAKPHPTPRPGSTGNDARTLFRPSPWRSRRQGGRVPHRRETERQATGVHAGGTPALPGGHPPIPLAPQGDVRRLAGPSRLVALRRSSCVFVDNSFFFCFRQVGDAGVDGDGLVAPEPDETGLSSFGPGDELFLRIVHFDPGCVAGLAEIGGQLGPLPAARVPTAPSACRDFAAPRGIPNTPPRAARSRGRGPLCPSRRRFAGSPCPPEWSTRPTKQTGEPASKVPPLPLPWKSGAVRPRTASAKGLGPVVRVPAPARLERLSGQAAPVSFPGRQALPVPLPGGSGSWERRGSTSGIAGHSGWAFWSAVSRGSRGIATSG